MAKINRTQVTAWTEDHVADCAVVLTGGPYRVREGFDLLAQKRIKKLILSGVHPKAYLREVFPQWPFYGDLKEEDVILEKRSKTTYGNIQQSLPLMEALYCRDVILITSRLHMYRALKTLTVALPEGFPVYSRSILSSSYKVETLDLWSETAKSLFYRLFAY